MTRQDEQHVQEVATRISDRVTTKYRAGVSEHGGHLWEKAGMLRHAEDEITDLVVYAHTLREQLVDVLAELSQGHLLEAEHNLRRILGRAEQ